jgi:protein TonB
MAFVELGQYPSRRAISLASVVLVHVALGYAFVNGLAFKVIRERITVMDGYNVEEKKPPKEIPKEDPVKREIKHVPPLDVDIVIPRVDEGLEIHMPPKQPPAKPDEGAKVTPPPQLGRTLQVKGDRASWVTTDDYPSDAIRNGQEGRVQITVQVGANGRVTSCQVTHPSGVESLDTAACYYYSKRAKFLPAQAMDGTPVASSRVDWVKWQLPAE